MTQLGKYDILEELGRGGFGIVYKARDLNLDRVVALKVLHPQLTVDPRFVENFKREARHMAKVEHPNVVSVYEINEVEGRLLIAMRYLPGGSLADRIAEGPLEEEEALKIVSEAAAGLAAGHEKGIVHRDVKPANIIFDDKGHAVVTDFGVARAVHVSSMGTTAVSGGMVGTPYYRPPELWRGTPKPCPATDVYSLGCVLYEMLTGEVLFSGETPDQVMTSHVLDDTQILMRSRQGKVPTAIRPALEKALAKEPSQRYQSMCVFTRALEGALEVGVVEQGATPDNIPGKSGQRQAQQPGSGEKQEKPQESSSRNPQTIANRTKNSQTTALSKKGLPAWLPWVIFGAWVMALIWVLALGSLLKGGSESDETAQETQAFAYATEEAAQEAGQHILTENTKPTLVLTSTRTLIDVDNISTLASTEYSDDVVNIPEEESNNFPYIGLSALPSITLTDMELLGLSQATGAYVVDTVQGGPADEAGLEAGEEPTKIQGLYAGGDLIIRVDGQEVIQFNDLLSYMFLNKRPGDDMDVTILRDGEEMTLTIVLGVRPDSGQ